MGFRAGLRMLAISVRFDPRRIDLVEVQMLAGNCGREPAVLYHHDWGVGLLRGIFPLDCKRNIAHERMIMTQPADLVHSS
jgi:hypothetical protein